MLKASNGLYVVVLTIIFYMSIGSVCTVFAEGMRVKSGLWETKSYVTTPGNEHENIT